MMNPNNIKACFFDLDGTLMDSEVAWLKSLEEALNSYGVELPKGYGEEIYGRDWDNVYNYISMLFSKNIPSVDDLKEKVLFFHRKKDASDMVIRESKELLVKLSEKYKIAIVSGASNASIRHCINIMNIQQYVDFYVGYDEYRWPKPDPECYLLAAERACVMPSECIVFEDSEVGVRSAKAAGAYCVALSSKHAYHQNHSEADIILSSLDQFNLL